MYVNQQLTQFFFVLLILTCETKLVSKYRKVPIRMLTKLLREKIHLQKYIIHFIPRETDSKIVILYINPI